MESMSGNDEDTGDLLLDPDAIGDLDEVIGEFQGTASGAAAEGTAVVPANMMDIQRAIDAGVSMATQLIEPLPPGKSAKLRVEGGVIYPVAKSVVILGRGKEVVDVLLPNDTQVSRQHAAVIFARGDFYIEDLASSNGTYVGDRRVRRGKLKSGDDIRIGKFKIRIQTN